MSISVPPPRSSQASGFAPPPPPPPMNFPQPMRGSSIFQAPPHELSVPPQTMASIAQPAVQPISMSMPPGPPPPPMDGSTVRPMSRMEPPPMSSTIGPMPGTVERPLQGPRKRLIVTCDGTWLDQDNMKLGEHQQPSNVTRLGWAIKETSRDGIPQVVNYQAGVGTYGGRLSRYVGGATALGLKQNVREAYAYLAINWREGDEIFLIGFSRGAYTARCVGGLIGAIGLLSREGLPYFSEIFEDYEHRNDDSYTSLSPNEPFPNKHRFGRAYIEELAERGYTQLPIPIKAICCFDTVGSLGIPRVPLLEALGLQSRGMKAYQFFDTSLHPCIENAFQALALDEKRGPFSPALWEKRRDNDRTNLKQVWFPGVHANIGGGYEDQEIANITLAWMMSRLEPFLDFRLDFLMTVWDESRAYYKAAQSKPRGWSFGQLYNSMKGAYSFTGAKIRTPGNYYRVDPVTGRPTDKRLKNTNEYIHASVRSRVGLKGPGLMDKGNYEPAALSDWTFDVEVTPNAGVAGSPDGTMIVWTDRSGRKDGGQERIPEAILLESELALLRQSPRVEEYIRDMRIPRKEKRRTKHRMMDADRGDLPNGALGTNPPEPGTYDGLTNGFTNEKRRSRYDDSGLESGAEDPARRRRRHHHRDQGGDGEKRRSRRYDD